MRSILVFKFKYRLMTSITGCWHFLCERGVTFCLQLFHNSIEQYLHVYVCILTIRQINKRRRFPGNPTEIIRHLNFYIFSFETVENIKIYYISKSGQIYQQDILRIIKNDDNRYICFCNPLYVITPKPQSYVNISVSNFRA